MLLKRKKKSQRARQTETTSVSSTHREKYSQQRAATNQFTEYLDLAVHDWLCYAQKESKAHDFQVLVKERTVFIFKPWLFFTPSSLSSK